MRPRLLAERFRLDSIRLADPVRRLANGADDFLLRNEPLSMPMMMAMDQMLDNSFAGDLRRVHLEAKATELVCLFSQALNDRSGDIAPVKLTARDIEALHEVRRVLSSRVDERPGIEALSRHAGINRNKLTYGFRHLFDRTISEFSLDARLQEAMKLLRDTDLPVGTIANHIGYGQASAFSTAFRRRFGVTPLQARKG